MLGVEPCCDGAGDVDVAENDTTEDITGKDQYP